MSHILRVLFDGHQKNLRDDWFSQIEPRASDRWTELGPIGEGESQSVRVQNNTDGMRGVAKPGPIPGAQQDVVRAANERLAFDLAYLLRLPVSPVRLWSEGAPATYKTGRAISCWGFQNAMKWSEAARMGLIKPAQVQSASAMLSIARVFHTWIGDTDRKPDHTIVDLDSPDDELRFVFIDHGNSLGHTFHIGNPPIRAAQMEVANVNEDRAAMAEAADHIAQIPDEEVSRVIHRIPILFLPAPRAALILSNLLARKGNLRAALGL
ncbi:MAG: hypothetical protein KGJ53_10980 [Alphaproteobacteria bacterium]|nr:hypothetical protein [Alphaproteobacteria bacterium]